MALDGKITATRKVAEGIEIEIGSRNGSCAGQNKMTIKNNPRWEPQIGDQIWGGSSSAFIERGDTTIPYKRELYTTLIENY